MYGWLAPAISAQTPDIRRIGGSFQMSYYALASREVGEVERMPEPSRHQLPRD
jgi:hypothetical protein